MKERTCYRCKYFVACGDAKRTEPCEGYEMEIGRTEAIGFWNDLRGTFYHGDHVHATSATVQPEFVAELMGISVENAAEFLWACVRYKLSDRQNGGFVI